MAERRVSKPKLPRARRTEADGEGEEPRARFANGVPTEAIFKDPAWADYADAMVNAIFVHGHPKRLAEAIAADIVVQVKSGKTLAEIAVAVPSKGEDQRAAYRAGLDEAPRILRGRLAELPRSILKEVIADDDAELSGWAKKLLADKAVWEKGRRQK